MVVSLGAALICGSCSRTPKEQESPKDYNVLLVTLDTTRADRLGCYEHSRETSPHLDALADDGVKFELAIAQAAQTPTSHASILTGLNPYQHGLRVMYAAKGYRLKDSVPTLATVLAKHGWDTGAFLSSFTVSEFFGFDRGFELFDNGLSRPADKVLRKWGTGVWGWDVQPNQRRSDVTTDRAIEWLHQARRPFFMWVHYWDPHDIAVRPPGEVLVRFARDHKSAQESTQKSKLTLLYDAEIYYMDSQFGRLLQVLKDLGEYDRTIIVAVGDHGEGLGDHDWWYHRLLYQEQIRVPLIIRIPDEASRRVVSELVRTTDIFPTVLEALGISGYSPVAGRSLRGLMSGRGEAPRVAYADALNLFDLNVNQERLNNELLYCAMDRRWKFIYRPRRPDESELYDLENDPGELNNVYRKAPAQWGRLLAKLEEFGGFVERPFGRGDDPDTLERLRSLGYVGDGTAGLE